MINFDLHNSTTKISNIEKDVFFKLRQEIKYVDKNTMKYARNAYLATQYLIELDQSFPSGLLPLVCNWLKKNGHSYNINDHRLFVKSSVKYSEHLDEPKLYPDQKNALEQALRFPRGIICLPTGVGKTRTFKELIKLMGKKFIVITPSLNLTYQTYSYLAASLGAKSVALYKKNQKPKNVVVVNYQTLPKIEKEYFDFFDGFIIDEFHHSANKTIRDNIGEKTDGIYHRYAFTATNYRNNPDEEILLNSVIANSLYTLSTKDAIKNGYILPVDGKQINIQNESAEKLDSYHETYRRYVCENDERNEQVIEYAKYIQSNNKGQTLILVKEIAHGVMLNQEINGSQFVSGLSPKDNHAIIESFNRKEIQTLIGTSVIGEGVDTKSCNYLINASGGKARSELMQKIGRVVRRDEGKKIGHYIDFNDRRIGFLRNHSSERAKIFNEEFGIPIDYI